MSKKTKTIMAFLTAMTMTAGAMGVTAYAEETTTMISQTAETEKSATGLTYEIDDPDYKAEIDSLYDYVPYEDLVLKCLNMLMDNDCLHKEPREEKWYYKHVYIDDQDFEIEHNAPTEIDTIKAFTAKSLEITAEQGKADDIEARDGKVRKFNSIDIYWSILVADKAGLDKDEINAYMKEQGLISHVVNVSPTQFALHFDDDNFTTEDVLKAIAVLNEKYGIIPGTVANEHGCYDLYYDSEYTGNLTRKSIKSYNTSVEWQPDTESKEATSAIETEKVTAPTVVDENTSSTEVHTAETQAAIADKATATLKGDADLNGEVSLTDIVVVSKNTLSDEAYPLKNDIAFANADMNDDTKVDAVDTSALIEDQLHRE
jgi:hypothetical protein